MNMTQGVRSFVLVIAVVAGIAACQSSPVSINSEQRSNPLLESYAEMASVAYSAALMDAEKLKAAIDELAVAPDQINLDRAKQAWLRSRESYGLTEVFRLSNGPIDSEEGWIAQAYGALEGQINAWPLDENMIDYTIDANGVKTSGNIIDSKGIFNPGGEDAREVDVTKITVSALSDLNENGGEANVASGYHAIEFLLWGQDQDYADFATDEITHGPLTAGLRPISDFSSDPFAQRRLQYLQAASQKLVSDLKLVVSAWSVDTSSDCASDVRGCYRAALLGELRAQDADKNIPEQIALAQIISGMGVFIKSELANERIAVAVLTPSEEDEHSCFSDNTHRDITLNYQGFVNVLKGQFNGKSYPVNLYSKASQETRAHIDALIASIDRKVERMNELAQSKWHFDYQILPQNNARELRRMKNEMRKLGDQMVAIARDINISLNTEDVTDPDETKI